MRRRTATNAAVAAQAYLADPGRRARPLSDLDWVVAPDAEASTTMDLATELVDASGTRYRLDAGYGPGLRWTRRAPRRRGVSVVCLRTVVGALEDYEPARSLARAALAQSGDQHHLAAELQALAEDPHELNRLLRVAVLRRVDTGQETLSNIAMRCGRPKSPGHHMGDTAWLRRRIGDAPRPARRARRRGSAARCWRASPATASVWPPVRSSWPDALDRAAPPLPLNAGGGDGAARRALMGGGVSRAAPARPRGRRSPP
ncbi:MAG: hypothetical protein ABI950_03245 [Solirubrobacteraceae bacterium]